MRARQLATPAVCGLLIVGLFSGCASAKTSNVQPLGGTSSAAAASASPSPTPVPASPFEDDPAVKALRSWTAQLAKTVNAGKTDDPALDALMTAAVRAQIDKIVGSTRGFYFPGPLPFSPIQVTRQSAIEHRVNLCVVSDGYVQDPKTHKPDGVHTIAAFDGRAELVNNQWLVSGFYTSTFSCDGVKVPEPTW